MKKTFIIFCYLRTRYRASISPSPPVTDNHPPNPHRIPRSKGTEQLENSVLDIAASILAALEDVDEGDQVAIVSPASPTFDKGHGGVVDSPAPSAFSEVVAQIL